jgi:hypothetical protein
MHVYSVATPYVERRSCTVKKVVQYFVSPIRGKEGMYRRVLEMLLNLAVCDGLLALHDTVGSAKW